MILQRRLHRYTEVDFDACDFEKTISLYANRDLTDLIAHHYSKISAILNPSCQFTPEICRALLTDQGMLFAQTREWGIKGVHSRRYCETDIPYSVKLHDCLLSQAGQPYEIDIGKVEKAIFKNVRAKCYYIKEEWPNLDDDSIISFLSHLLDQCGSLDVFAAIKLTETEDCGYIDADIARYSSQPLQTNEDTVVIQNNRESSRQSSAEIVLHMCKQWLSGCKVTIPGQPGQSSLEICPSMDLFTQYKLFSRILPSCIEQVRHIFQYLEEQNRPWEYIPGIDIEQKCEMEKQIASFRSDTLQNWKNAREVLSNVYAPEISRYMRLNRRHYSINSEPECERLMTDCIYQRLVNMLGNKRSARIKDISENMGTFFTSYIEKGDSGGGIYQPTFLDQPWVIFQVVRSLSFISIADEDQKPDIYRIVKSVCIDMPVPFSDGLFKADGDLFYELVEICNKGCEILKVKFPYVAWRSLWPCIEQCVKSISFEPRDMITYCSGFKLSAFKSTNQEVEDSRNLKAVFSKSMEAWLDFLLYKKYSDFSPRFWRSIINAILSDRENDIEKRIPMFIERFLDPYAKLFTDPAADALEVIKLTQAFAAKFGWNYISYTPRQEIFEAMLKKNGFHILKAKPRKHPPEKTIHSSEITRLLHYIKTSQSEYKFSEPKNKQDSIIYDNNDLRSYLIEWALLQMLCARTQLRMIQHVDHALRSHSFL